jgi:hypothetical protein
MSELFKAVQISGVTSFPGGVEFSADNLLSGHTNILLSASNPAGPWQPIATNFTTGTSQLFSLNRTNSAAFYRVQELP